MKEKDFQVAVFIGRFQPFHLQHLDVLKKGLEIADKVVVVIGSANLAPNIKNPFSFEERVSMISSCFTRKISGSHGALVVDTDDLSRVEFVGVRDYYYNDQLWCAEIQQKVSQFVKPGDNVALLGTYKDASSYYLNLFPQWEFNPSPQSSLINATDIRHLMFSNPFHDMKQYEALLPVQIQDWLETYFFGSSKDIDLQKEYEFINKYQEAWKAAPYLPTFVTTDAVVICSGHVLVIKRKFNPGKGLYALPGGFVKASERLEDGALRELKEETAIDVLKTTLRSNIQESRVFDYPGRSLRGRTITHAYFIKLTLNVGELPRVKGGSDADKVYWMPIHEFYKNQEKFYEDHFAIIEYFIQRS